MNCATTNRGPHPLLGRGVASEKCLYLQEIRARNEAIYRHSVSVLFYSKDTFRPLEFSGISTPKKMEEVSCKS